MPNNLAFLKASMTAFKETLGGASDKQKGDLISIPTADHFNGLLDRIRAEAPEVAPHLPPRVTAKSDFSIMGKSDIKFLELEMLVNQVIHVLGVLASDA